MRRLLLLLLSIIPSAPHVLIRRMMGQKIGKNARLRIGTIILSDKVEIGENTHIGPFTYINAQQLTIGSNSAIKSFSVIKTRVIKIANYVQIAPFVIISSEFTINSYLIIGDHSRVFPFCWLETGEGIEIGSQVGIGGHTLMFTHGVWPSYIDGGPVSYGPIILKDNVWLPWRVFILPNVTINENVIIGANSLINKSIQANALAAGSPAKVLKENVYQINESQKLDRFNEILTQFAEHLRFVKKMKVELTGNRLKVADKQICLEEWNDVKSNDLIVLIKPNATQLQELLKNGMAVLNYSELTIYKNNTKNKFLDEFISFLRRFGVRVYIK